MNSILSKRLYNFSGVNFVARRISSALYKGETVGAKEQDFIEFEGVLYRKDEVSNVSSTILSKIGPNLHNSPAHPLCQLKQRIQTLLVGYKHYDQFSPIVKVEDNFDRLLIGSDHPGRAKSASFFFNKSYMLRTHTTTHEPDVYLYPDVDKFTITADVYRRDEIDRTHYPVFHQMECVQLFEQNSLSESRLSEINSLEGVKVSDPTSDLSQLSINNPVQEEHQQEKVAIVAHKLKNTLNKILHQLFGETDNPTKAKPLEIRWVESSFPFTSPSWEAEIFYQGTWLEVLGCGILKQKILNQAGRSGNIGWACGLGLERLAMVLHQIPDIRLFWSKDPRFLNQFNSKSNAFSIFRPFSKFPPCIKDISFWCPSLEFEPNDLFDLVRDVAGDVVESVTQVDTFVHPKTGRKSLCYRITYRSMERNITNEEINVLQMRLREEVQSRFKVELR